jgi:hypothetical protein
MNGSAQNMSDTKVLTTDAESAKMEEALILEIQRERQSRTSVGSDYNVSDAGELRRILSRSTMWLYDRDLVHDTDETDDKAAVSAALSRCSSQVYMALSRRQSSVSSRSPFHSRSRTASAPMSEDGMDDYNNNQLHHTSSALSLTRAENRLTVPSFGDEERRGSRIRRTQSDQSKQKPTMSLSTVPTAAATGASAAAGGTGKYIKFAERRRAPTVTTASSLRLDTLGEEEAIAEDKQPNRLQKNNKNDSKKENPDVKIIVTSADGSYDNPVMCNKVIDPATFDVDTFGEYVVPATWM